MQGLYLVSKLPKLMPNTFITSTQPTTTAAYDCGKKDSEKKELEVRGGYSISKVKLVMIDHFKPFLVFVCEQFKLAHLLSFKFDFDFDFDFIFDFSFEWF